MCFDPKPKTCKWFIKGLLPHQTFSHVMFAITLGRIRLWTYIVISTTFARKLWFNFICCNRHHIISISGWFFLSTIPFYFDTYRMVVYVNPILLVEYKNEVLEIIFFNYMMLNHLQIIISNLIFHQKFENLKLVQHTKLSLYDVKECHFTKIINESHNIFCPSTSYYHGTTQVCVNKL